MSEPIDRCIENWHALLRHELEGEFASLLHPDVVFYSPVVFTPQRGAEITELYLRAAEATLGQGDFRYVREIRQGHQAMLEFETTMDGKVVNGVDIITCDDDAMIVEFKVLVRPLQGVQAVHQQMMNMLAQFEAGS
jgi:hypothetical protein